MEIQENYKKSLNNFQKFEEEILKKLLQNCYNVLTGKSEVYAFSHFPKETSLEIKELYAALLYIFTESVRHGQSKDEFSQFLSNECNFNENMTKICGEFYEESRRKIRTQLLNIGSHLPHVTDVRWKVDYIVKSDSMDQSGGPVFRVSLRTEKYSEDLQGKKIEFLEFTCTSQELQDLVYKLKDAVRHCQKLSVEH